MLVFDARIMARLGFSAFPSQRVFRRAIYLLIILVTDCKFDDDAYLITILITVSTFMNIYKHRQSYDIIFPRINFLQSNN